MGKTWRERCPVRRAGIFVGGMVSLAAAFAISTAPAEDLNTAAPNPAARGAKKRLTFEEDIVPILQARCFKCHGPKVRKSGLDLRRRFTMLKGGESGAAIVPGKPDDSPLIEMITSGNMPPKGEGRLGKRQLALLSQWVATGAPIKGDSERPLEVAENDIEVTDQDRKFWAFQPPVRPNVPAIKAARQVRNPIDAFLLAKLEQKDATFNADASKHVLIRRVYFDLLGLPPTPAEIDSFVADERPDAYQRLIDRLLASVQYGERWGRHWLDVAGYADSDGYLEADRLRPEAWRYRDYVVRAYNADKPFDRFVLEQVAGDELADWRRQAEISPEIADNLIATGFLRTASDPTYGNYSEPLECYKVMADTMQIFSSAFLGLTLQCARCHSHKFDPISHRDYYKMHAIFVASYDPKRWLVSASRTIPLATEAEAARIGKTNKQADARIKQLNGEIGDLTNRYRNRFLDEKLKHLTDKSLQAKVKAALLVDVKKRNDEQKKLIAAHAPKVTATEANISQRFAPYKSSLGKLRAAIAAESALKKPIVGLRGLADLADKTRQAHLLRRGDFNRPGRPVDPGVPAVLAPAGFKLQPKPGYKTSGRRAALARWLVDPQHPLTARVHVNRIWAHHFGRGIVKTLDNFGKNGTKPSHPELLDWLAIEFMANGWSQKALHRLIMTSAAYRQSSKPNPELRDSDPDNVLLGRWRSRRHQGEIIRDTVLSVTGKLNPRMFGSPVPIKRHSDGLVTVADDPRGNRRSIYLIVRRTRPVTLLNLFDTPRMEVNCTLRSESIVVTQALAMMNSKFIETSAEQLAERILVESTNDQDERIDLAYKLIYGRLPRDDERETIGDFLDAVAKAQLAETGDTPTEEQKTTAEKASWTQLAIVLLNSNEFLYVP